MIKDAMRVPLKFANGKKAAGAGPRRTPPRGGVPRPPGAAVELQHATGTEQDLLSHRAMLEAVGGLEFPLPKVRFAGRGIVIRAIERHQEGGSIPFLSRVEWNFATPHLATVQSIRNTRL
jgi:hypothetical protein